MHSLLFPPGTQVNDVIQVEHDWRRHQWTQSWELLREKLSHLTLPETQPLCFILNWHDPKRWPMPRRL